MNEHEHAEPLPGRGPLRGQATAPAAAVTAADRQRKREEFRTWVFLTVVMAPLLAVLIVAGYGFLVWIYQMLAGPPTYG